MKDAWGKPKQSVFDLTDLKQGDLTYLNNTVKDATDKEVNDWLEEDFFMSMKFDPLVMFVVIPTLIQITVMGMMFMMFAVINLGTNLPTS